MKRFLTIIFVLFVLLGLTGCLPQNEVQINETDERELLISSLSAQYPTSKNISIVGPIKDFREYRIVVVSYDDFSGAHFVDYRFFKVKDNQIEFFGGGGGQVQLSQNIKLSLSSGGGTLENNEYYLITYGETYSSEITRIKLYYSDGTISEEPIINGGYLVVKVGGNVGVTKVDALDNENSIVYEIP